MGEQKCGNRKKKMKGREVKMAGNEERGVEGGGGGCQKLRVGV